LDCLSAYSVQSSAGPTAKRFWDPPARTVSAATFKIGNTSVVLHPLETVSVAIDNLGKPVGSLREEADQIISALDQLLLRI
jgi:toxin CcdB